MDRNTTCVGAMQGDPLLLTRPQPGPVPGGFQPSGRSPKHTVTWVAAGGRAIQTGRSVYFVWRFTNETHSKRHLNGSSRATAPRPDLDELGAVVEAQRVVRGRHRAIGVVGA